MDQTPVFCSVLPRMCPFCSGSLSACRSLDAVHGSNASFLQRFTKDVSILFRFAFGLPELGCRAWIKRQFSAAFYQGCVHFVPVRFRLAGAWMPCMDQTPVFCSVLPRMCPFCSGSLS